MFARALFVLLLVLNVGVATWWATRPLPSASGPIAAPVGAARLQLFGEAYGGDAAMAPPPAAAAFPMDASQPSASGVRRPAQCFSFGPFLDDQVAVAAQARLQAITQRIVLRQTGRGSTRRWRVMLPPLPSAEEAATTAQRIATAGFGDYFIVRQGAEVNAIALGRYGNEAAARRRAAALVAAGFAARAEPLGGTATWLDVRAAPGFDPAAAQRLAAAPGRRDIDCVALP